MQERGSTDEIGKEGRRPRHPSCGRADAGGDIPPGIALAIGSGWLDGALNSQPWQIIRHHVSPANGGRHSFLLLR